MHNLDGMSVAELRDRVISHTTHLGLVSALMCGASISALLSRSSTEEMIETADDRVRTLARFVLRA